MAGHMVQVAVVFTFIALLVSVGVSAAQDWQTQGGDFQRSSQYPGTFDIPLGQQWSYSTVGGISASMVLAGGELYVGSWDGYLYAINAVTGELLWRTYTGNQVLSSPTVGENVIYIGSNHNVFLAFSRTDGSLVWEFPANAPVTASPVISDGIIIIGSQQGNIYALDSGSGELLWRFATGSPVVPSPCYLNGTVYIATVEGVVWAINATTGTLVEHIEIGSWITQSPVAFQGVGLLVTTGECIYALEFEELDLLWKTCYESNVSTGIAFYGQQIYFGTEDDKVRSIETLFLEQKWASPLGIGLVSAPLVSKNILIWITSYGNIIAVNSLNGFLMWEMELGVHPGPQPIIYNGTLYLALQDGTVLAMSGDYPPITHTTASSTATTNTTATTMQNWTFPPIPSITELPASSAIFVLFAFFVVIIFAGCRKQFR